MTYPTKKLGEIVELHYGKGISKHERKPDGKYPVYGANGILDYSDKFLVDSDAVIVGRKGSAGEVTRIWGKFWPSDVTYFVLGNDKIDIDYLFHALKNLNLQRLAVGVKPGINRNRIYELEIPLPPIAEQKKIVAKLEKVLGKIREAKKFREEAESAAKALLPAELHRIFTHPTNHNNTPHKQHTNKLEFIRMSDKWEEKELGEVFVLNYGKGLSRLERSEDGRYIVYGANGELGRSDKYLIEGDGIIIGRKGSAGEITRASGRYWPTDVTYFVTVGRRYDIGFAYYLFKFLNFPQYAAGVKPGINRNQIYEIKIPLPPIAEQKKIVARLDALSDKIRILRQAQAKTAADFTALEQSILSKSMSNK
jgi:type I restriction enzyme, S subunit